ncbi:MAG: LamG domain-containing protein, partial [Deltaproteobacteria bacterium]
MKHIMHAGTLPNGTRELAAGKILPALWGAAGMFALGWLGLSRAYRATLRFYRANERAQPAATNRVLELDGSASYVELPPNLLAGAREMTVEAWLKWDQLSELPSVTFSYGEISGWFLVGSADRNNIGCGLIGSAGLIGGSGAGLANILELHQWYHVAAVASTNGILFYVNGSLVGTNAFQERLFTTGPVQRAFLGQSEMGLSGRVDVLVGFRGQMDDVRLWNTARTAEQIRGSLGRMLGGSEAGLVGLWSFDDPANPGRDASPGAHHGKLLGRA